MANTNVERMLEVYAHLWSDDPAANPIPPERRQESVDSITMAYQQLWPEGITADPENPCAVPAEFSNNQKAGVVLNAFRLWVKDLRAAYRIGCAEHAAGETEKDELENEEPAPPIDDSEVTF